MCYKCHKLHIMYKCYRACIDNLCMGKFPFAILFRYLDSQLMKKKAFNCCSISSSYINVCMCMSMYIYICQYICMHVYIFTYVYICMDIL